MPISFYAGPSCRAGNPSGAYPVKKSSEGARAKVGTTGHQESERTKSSESQEIYVVGYHFSIMNVLKFFLFLPGSFHKFRGLRQKPSVPITAQTDIRT